MVDGLQPAREDTEIYTGERPYGVTTDTTSRQ